MEVTYPEGGIVGITMRQEQQKTGYGNNNNHMNNVRVKLITTRSIPKTKLSSPREVADYARSSMENLDREYAKIILLDTKNQVLGTETISIGSLNASIVHPREAVTSAVLSKSASTIFLHNHPSGSCEPSLEDREITRTLARAFSDLGIKLVDSIIIGRGCYYSFLEDNPAVLAVQVSDKPQTVTTVSEYGNRYGNGYTISETVKSSVVAAKVQTPQDIKQQYTLKLQSATSLGELEQIRSGIAFLPLPNADKNQLIDIFNKRYSVLTSQLPFGVPIPKQAEKPRILGAQTPQQRFEEEQRRKAAQKRISAGQKTLTSAASKRLSEFGIGERAQRYYQQQHVVYKYSGG